MKVELQDNARRRKGGYLDLYIGTKLAMSAANLATMLATAGRTEVWLRENQSERNATRGAAPLRRDARSAVRSIDIGLKRVTVRQ